MRRDSIVIVLVTMLVLGLLSGCSRAPGRGGPRVLRTAADSLDDWRARADSIDRTLARLPRVEGRLPLGAATSRYTAWYREGRLCAIREELNLGEQGARTSHYYFANDIPRFTLEAGTVLAGSVQSATLKEMVREMLFDDSGALAAGRKTLDGALAPVAPFEGAVVEGHAQQLRLAAQLLRMGTPPAAPAPGDSAGR